jgi:SNF2 family DNA or RNA helicase
MKKIIGDDCTHIEDQFAGMIIKNDLDFVKSSFNMTPTYYYDYDCFQPLYRALVGLVNDNIKSMIEADNIEGAIEALGGTKTKNILELVKQKLLEELENIESKIRIYILRNESSKIEEWNSKKRLISNKLLTIENRFESMISGNCNICFEKLSNPIMEPSCNNLFCGRCILTWLQTKQNCPLCRQNIVVNQLIYMDENKSIESKSENHKLTKQEMIVKIIKEKPDSKFIIFSSYDQTFDQIHLALADNNINFKLLKGSVQQIQRTINDYKSGDLQVLFLNSKFNGSGINLQETTDIILYHDMSEATKTQLIGRANRIGRTSPLHVHQLKSSE